MKEAGFSAFDLQQWFALQAPVSTPWSIIETLRIAIARAAANKAYQKSLSDRGAEPLVVAATEVERFALAEARKWIEVVRSRTSSPSEPTWLHLFWDSRSST